MIRDFKSGYVVEISILKWYRTVHLFCLRILASMEIHLNFSHLWLQQTKTVSWQRTFLKISFKMQYYKSQPIPWSVLNQFLRHVVVVRLGKVKSWDLRLVYLVLLCCLLLLLPSSIRLLSSCLRLRTRTEDCVLDEYTFYSKSMGE